MKQATFPADEAGHRVEGDRSHPRFEGDGPLAAVLARWEAASLREELEKASARFERREEEMRTTAHALGILSRRLLPAPIFAALKRLLAR